MLKILAVLVPTFFLAVSGQCDWGTYGEHCNLTCPVNCALVPSRNLQHCNRDTGKCSAGCRRGWHGDLCDQSCSTNCLNKTCNLQTGHCTLGCYGTNIGDFCNSTRECDRGLYGDTCKHPCNRNCVEERCNQKTGVCVLGCNGTYTGEFCNITTVSNIKEEADNLAAILVPVFLVVAVFATVVAVVVVLLWRRRKNRAQNAGASFNEDLLLSRGHTDEDGAEAEEKTPPETGIMTEDLLLQRMAQAEVLFEKTTIYHTVRKELKKHKHVTMSGTAGGGKTAIALVLGKQYNDRGFKVFWLLMFAKSICAAV
ncbi:protein draper-like isoform X3 [Haliotis rubra]|uniref:protein draper-like isoform X3 n=1 Tax=Haliotis rubra TaxID=36100 RepID=UPI001EE5FEDF|nr:protein draper-like isoform X3 [Haliotis rubra]